MTLPADGDRASILRRLAIFDSPPEPIFDALARTAQAIADTSSVLITFKDSGRRWFKARIGFEPPELTGDVLPCDHPQAPSHDILVVRDARADDRFRRNPLVTDKPHIRFYAAAPFFIDGTHLGTVSILDALPRLGFEETQRLALAASAALIEGILRLRLEANDWRAKAYQGEQSLRQAALVDHLIDVDRWTLDPEIRPQHQREFADTLNKYDAVSCMSVAARLAQGSAIGQQFDFQEPLIRVSDGSVRSVRCKAQMSNDGDKRLLIGLLQDVTEQEELIGQIRDERDQYRVLAQNATDVIATYKPDGTFTYLSPAIEALVGLAPSRLVGRKTYEIIHADDHERVDREFRALLARRAGSTRIEYRALTADGSIVWLEAHPSPIFDTLGHLLGFQDIVRDVSARKAAEIAAAEATVKANDALEVAAKSEARFRLLAENANDMIALTSPLDSSILFVSPGCRRVLGYEQEELLGRTTMSLTHPDDLRSVLRFFRDLIAAGPVEKATPYEFRGLHKDGRWIWLEGQPRVTFDDVGAPVQFEDVVRDISHRKQLENDLNAARVTAEAAAQAKSDFLANMSHEIRTPLNSIIGYTDLLMEDTARSSPMRRKLEIVQESSAALLTVVNDILDFSKLEAGQLELDPTPFSPRTLLANVVSMLAGAASRKGISISQTVSAHVPDMVLGDEGRVRQVLLNLVNNAVKFTEAGSVEIDACLENACGTELVGMIRFSVKDTGVGIPIEHQPRLFKRFSQGDGSISRKYGGSGLGLAICQRLVANLKGEIGLESRQDEGTTFWFSVPLPAADPARLDRERSLENREAARGAWILLVEDVPLNQDLAKAVLERSGHTVDIASNGAEAIEMVRRNRYDLVLMDVQMPIMDGVTATKIIRDENHLVSTIPIVAMTANVLPQQIALLKEAGMNDHVGKPFKRAELDDVIARWAKR